MHTKICEMFGIRYPIIQGGMQWLATPELAAAVSNAGGLGTVNSSISRDREDLCAIISKVRELTDKPFALNISMLPNLAAGDRTDEFMEVAIQEKIPIVETSGRAPDNYVGPLKDAGIRIIHKVVSVRHARKAELAGVDALSVIGFEAGGHPGMDDVGTLVLLPSVVEAVQIPVLASGGICDGNSYQAVRCLGAQGVVIGTRFMASRECSLHDSFKQALLSAQVNDTILVQRTIRNACRVLKNEATMALYALEANGNPTLEEVLPVVNGTRQRECYERGDVQTGTFPLGQCAGRIHEILPVREIIERMVEEADACLWRLNA